MRDELIQLLDRKDRQLRWVILLVGLFGILLLVGVFFSLNMAEIKAPALRLAFWLGMLFLAGNFVWAWWELGDQKLYKSLTDHENIKQVAYHLARKGERSWHSVFYINIVLPDGSQHEFFTNMKNGQRILKLIQGRYPDTSLLELDQVV
ncbi:hypothetical protein [Persicobacter diffluens]|uniref:Uncharacterized protein n=1 Tax=Persicobacter diffluens TaxID=981 RepID=A0AAN4VVD4_9BACT|nr:hypothetical protein PEDI_12030 [Persicobacter diffluens]